MRARSLGTALVAAALIGASVAAYLGLISGRIAAGDAYPRYSSLRRDPLGASVLYESLAELPGLRAERNLQPVGSLAGRPGSALFRIGAPPYGPGYRDLFPVAVAGARVVVAFAPDLFDPIGSGPAGERPSVPEPPEKAVPEPPEEAKESKPPEKGTAAPDRPRPDRGLRLRRMPGLTPALRRAVRKADEPDLPAAIPWRGTRYFDRLDPGWRVLYAMDGWPVAVERPVGRGRLVLLADAYALSNEALLADRATPLLAWLAGRASRVVFDETHHGLYEPAGLTSLMRRTGMQGFGLGALVLAALFLWRALAPLVPAPPAAAAAGPRLAGRASSDGLANLLGRHLRPAEALEASIEIWSQHAGARSEARREPIRALARETADPAEAYRKIARTLHPEKRKGTP